MRQFPELLKINPALWHAHNVFLSIAVGLGIQGLAAFLFLLYRTLRSLWLRRGRPPDWLTGGPAGPVKAATLVMCIGFIISNLTTDLFEDDTALLYWLLVGCAFSMIRFVPGGRAGSEA